MEEHLQSLFKVVHVGPLATAVQSLVLLYQVMESQQAVSGRYYQALYSKLLDPQLRHSGKQVSLLSIESNFSLEFSIASTKGAWTFIIIFKLQKSSL